MPVYVAILRGINVAGSKPLKMADLRQTLESKGFENVITYLQSGNLSFQHASHTAGKLEKEIHSNIKKEYGYDVPVIVFQSDTLQEVMDENPYLKTADESKLHVSFLGEKPSTENLTKVQGIDSGEDEMTFYKQWIYLNCPNGYGRTKLNNNFLENKLMVKATTRNWKTVKKLLEMASS